MKTKLKMKPKMETQKITVKTVERREVQLWREGRVSEEVPRKAEMKLKKEKMRRRRRRKKEKKINRRMLQITVVSKTCILE